MRRVFVLLLTVFFAIAVIGCKSTYTIPSSGTQAKKAADTAVPLAKGFPKDFPMIKGIVTASMTYNTVNNGEGVPVGISYYTQVKTEMSADEALAFYKSKFSEVKKEQPLKNGTGQYVGFINGHAVSVFVTQKNPKDKTLVTVIVSEKKTSE